MANLEDTAVALRKRMEQLGKIYEKYLDNRERFREVVETFDDDLATLHQGLNSIASFGWKKYLEIPF